jgi:hypothetical protein
MSVGLSVAAHNRVQCTCGHWTTVAAWSSHLATDYHKNARNQLTLDEENRAQHTKSLRNARRARAVETSQQKRPRRR